MILAGDLSVRARPYRKVVTGDNKLDRQAAPGDLPILNFSLIITTIIIIVIIIIIITVIIITIIIFLKFSHTFLGLLGTLSRFLVLSRDFLGPSRDLLGTF